MEWVVCHVHILSTASDVMWPINALHVTQIMLYFPIIRLAAAWPKILGVRLVELIALPVLTISTALDAMWPINAPHASTTMPFSPAIPKDAARQITAGVQPTP